jgi:hypothetical protein
MSTTLSRPKMKWTVTDPNSNGSQIGDSEEQDSEIGDSTRLGLNVKYRPWSLGFSVGGLLAKFYTPEMYNGLEVTIFAIDYSWGNGEKAVE